MKKNKESKKVIQKFDKCREKEYISNVFIFLYYIVMTILKSENIEKQSTENLKESPLSKGFNSLYDKIHSEMNDNGMLDENHKFLLSSPGDIESGKDFYVLLGAREDGFSRSINLVKKTFVDGNDVISVVTYRSDKKTGKISIRTIDGLSEEDYKKGLEGGFFTKKLDTNNHSSIGTVQLPKIHNLTDSDHDDVRLLDKIIQRFSEYSDNKLSPLKQEIDKLGLNTAKSNSSATT